MLPCSMRRRSCSGEESTSSIWSALRTTQSGTRSRTCAPVMCSTASAMLSRCWMLTVVMTSMPASSSSRTSCQRFRCRPSRARWYGPARRPGRAWDGGPARRRGPSPRIACPVVDGLARHDLQAVDQRFGERPPVALDEPDDDVGAPLLAPVALVEHGVGLADALPRLPDRYGSGRPPRPPRRCLRPPARPGFRPRRPPLSWRPLSAR